MHPRSGPARPLVAALWMAAVPLLAASRTMEAPPQEPDDAPPVVPVVLPERVLFVNPSYPVEMRVRRNVGGCALRFRVDAGGRVDHVSAIAISPGGGPFAESAIASLCRWRYRPALYRGMPVPRQLTAVFLFCHEDPSGGSVDQADWRPPAEPSEPRRCDAAGNVHAGSAPDAWPPTDDIDVAAGGPAPLALGSAIASIAGLETALPGLAFNPMPEGRVLVSWPRQGLEATLVFLEADKVFQVEALQFTFIEGLGPTPVETLRTREGLGAGSSCELVRDAFGTPGKENRLVDGDHRQWLTLTCLFGGTTAEFLCIEDALARLRLHSPAASR